MRVSKLLVLLTFTALVAIGCESDFLATGRSLELTASMSDTELAVGEDATLRITLRNHGDRPVELNFPHSCQILPYIETAVGQLVYPQGGWGCLTVLTRLHLAPGEEKVQTLQVRGGVPQPAIHTGAALPPGEYRAYAELGEKNRVILRSNAVGFRVHD